MHNYKFQIFRDKSNQFRFRFKAPNGEIMLASEAYIAKESAKKAIETLREEIAKAKLEDIS